MTVYENANSGVVPLIAIARFAGAAEEGRVQAPAGPQACTSVKDFLATDCTPTWYGITVYGAYDIGLGWVSHGLPENAYNYEGESLVNRNGNNSRFLIAPNNLSQTGFGIKIKEEFVEGWSVVANASTGINPQSGQLVNMGATMTMTTACPGAATRLPAMARVQDRPSMTSSMAASPRCHSGRSPWAVSEPSGRMRCSLTIRPAAPILFRLSAITG